MVDIPLFKYHVMKEGYTMGEISKILKIDSSTLTRKISGTNEFKIGEIHRLKNHLKLTPYEVDAIFFTNKLT